MDFCITIAPTKDQTKLTVRTNNRNGAELVAELARRVEQAVAEFAKQYSV